jgi:lipoprotein-anchoring transpeptidase ErfK/SrfK
MKAARLRAAAVLAFACAAAYPAAAQASAWTATVLEPAYARAHPDRGATLDHVGRYAPHWGGPNVLLVLDTATVDGRDYVKVLLKRMPAGSAGWIEADHVELARTTRRIVVDLSDRSVTLRQSGRAILKTRAVVGAPSTPTPIGQFAVDAPVDQPKGGLLGPRVLAMTAYSRALARYQGGIPQVAFHAYEKLGAPLGTASSHGCVRIPQAALTRLLRLAPRGTPVLIRR